MHTIHRFLYPDPIGNGKSEALIVLSFLLMIPIWLNERATNIKNIFLVPKTTFGV